MTFEIGKAVTEVPAESTGRGRYKAIYDAVAELEDGIVLPVTFDSITEAQNFYVSGRLQPLHAQRRGNVVYCSKRND